MQPKLPKVHPKRVFGSAHQSTQLGPLEGIILFFGAELPLDLALYLTIFAFVAQYIALCTVFMTFLLKTETSVPRRFLSCISSFNAGRNVIMSTIFSPSINPQCHQDLRAQLRPRIAYASKIRDASK